MTFKELLTENGQYPIVEDMLIDRADESDYWDSCHTFFRANEDTDLDDLSEKQLRWANKIADDMAEYRIERKNKR